VVVLFDVRVSEVEDWTVVTIVGELDLATVPQARQKVHPVTGRKGARVVLDLSDVDFLDSIGLGLIVGALKRVRDHGGELAVVVPEGRALRVFELTGLDRIMRLEPSVGAVVGAPPSHDILAAAQPPPPIPGRSTGEVGDG
jgi:anti-sigma B factor antagonist